MAKWNLEKAEEFYRYFSKINPRFLRKVQKKLSLKTEEVEKWVHVARRIKVPLSKSGNIIEEFDGYFGKKDIVLNTFDHYFMPLLPGEVSLQDIAKTQLVKQADVILCLYLLPEEFTKDAKIRNYLYYVKRTLHKSSLSPSVHSILASEIGDITRGYLYFLFSVYADLKNTYGNSHEGIHAANLGGAWQAAIMGFSGFRNINGLPSFEPRLPGHWRNMKFRLRWRDSIMNVKVTSRRIDFFVESGKIGFILIKCFNSVYKIPFNKRFTVLRTA